MPSKSSPLQQLVGDRSFKTNHSLLLSAFQFCGALRPHFFVMDKVLNDLTNLKFKSRIYANSTVNTQ